MSSKSYPCGCGNEFKEGVCIRTGYCLAHAPSIMSDGEVVLHDSPADRDSGNYLQSEDIQSFDFKHIGCGEKSN